MELRDALGDAASTTDTGEPSLDDLRAVVTRATRPRRLVFASIVATTLLTGMTVGLVAARPSGPAKVGVRTLDDARNVQPGAPSAPSAVAPAAAPQRSSVVAAAKPAPAASEPGSTTATTKAPTREGASKPEPADPKMRSLFRRTTADGVVIRAYDLTLPQRGAEKNRPTGPTGPMGVAAEQRRGNKGGAECRAPSHALRGELSNDAAVANAFAPIPDRAPGAQPPTLTVLGDGHWGAPEGQPAGWVAVQTGPGVAKVRLTVTGGGTDEMAPVEGLAILARNTDKLTGKVEALDASGKTVGSADVPGSRQPACGPRSGPRPGAGPGSPDNGQGFSGGGGRETGSDGVGAGRRL